jgi:DNA-binding transcriptional regulator/RsmH inhibitor MraZ
VLVPAYLREAIRLAGDAVVVGTRDHAEIWAPKSWDEYQRALDDPQALADAFQGLGI